MRRTSTATLPLRLVIGTGRVTRGGSRVRVAAGTGDGLWWGYGYPPTRAQSTGTRTRAHGSGQVAGTGTGWQYSENKFNDFMPVPRCGKGTGSMPFWRHQRSAV
ncbi:hypothetical protein DFH06DRAFT_1128917 [Mycena polygramma]|nr:hypothetical protein DFH06DRAFT_1128917 [Mycena polygramma]